MHFDEWELAARYIQDTGTQGDIRDAGDYYPGDYASGAEADTSNTTETRAVAWYSGNSGSETQEAGTKLPNALGLRDMSGNISEWCFGSATLSKHARGGNYSSIASSLQVGGSSTAGTSLTAAYNYYGFRIARTAE